MASYRIAFEIYGYRTVEASDEDAARQQVLDNYDPLQCDDLEVMSYRLMYQEDTDGEQVGDEIDEAWIDLQK